MSLRDEWLADPEPGSYTEWLRRRTVPAGLLTLPTPQAAAQERAKVHQRRAVTAKPRKPRASRANPNGREQVHGSTHAWKRHKKAGEDPCAECVAGHEAEKARRAADKRAKRPSRRVAKCGTPYMARKHRERGEDCTECKAAQAAAWRKRNPPKVARAA